MEYIEQEMRHRKKKRKTVKKASHKHLNEPCVLEYPANWFMKGYVSDKMRAAIRGYCPLCGKVNTVDNYERWYVSEKTLYGLTHEVTEEANRELDPATRTLPTFRVKDPFAKFVEVD